MTRSIVRFAFYTVLIIACLAVVGLADPIADLIINHIHNS